MPTLNVAVFVDQHVYDHHGYHPARVAREWYHGTLAFNDIQSYDVKLDKDIPFDGRDLDDDNTGDDSTDDTLEIYNRFVDYLQNTGKQSENDVNLLIFDENNTGSYGGFGDNGDNAAVAYGNRLVNFNETDPTRWVKNDPGGDDADQAQAVMQEGGHAMGLCPDSNHNCGFSYDDDDPYDTFSLPEETNSSYTTPMGYDSSGTNACGDDGVDPATYDSRYIDVYYYDECAGKKLRNIWN